MFSYSVFLKKYIKPCVFYRLAFFGFIISCFSILISVKSFADDYITCVKAPKTGTAAFDYLEIKCGDYNYSTRLHLKGSVCWRTLCPYLELFAVTDDSSGAALSYNLVNYLKKHPECHSKGSHSMAIVFSMNKNYSVTVSCDQQA